MGLWVSDDEQLSLPGLKPKTARRRAQRALVDPVARVAVVTRAKHVSDVYDYEVPEKLSAAAAVGCMVRVRFRGALTDGFVVQRCAASEFAGVLQPIVRVVGETPVVAAQVLDVAAQVQRHYGGSLVDVLRLAVPRRHVAGENAAAAFAPVPAPSAPSSVGVWADYAAGEAFLTRLAEGLAPKAACTYLPGFEDDGTPVWSHQVVVAAQVVASTGRSTLVIVPDQRSVVVLRAALDRVFAADAVVELTSAVGPRVRYEGFVRALAGQPQVVVGTRGAVWAPMPLLGLVVVHDDGHVALTDQRAPYPAVDWVARRRAESAECGVLLGSFVHHPRTYAAAAAGAVVSISGQSGAVRRLSPTVAVAGAATESNPLAGVARIDSRSVRELRAGVLRGTVLVSVPVVGEFVAAWCAGCGDRARCGGCGSALMVAPGSKVLQCGTCGFQAAHRCGGCGSAAVRHSARGAGHTVADVGRLVPGARVVTSTAAESMATRDPQEQVVVVATPGAEPVVRGGYAAAVVLDPQDLWGRASELADFEALGALARVVSLVMPAKRGGVVCVPTSDSQGLVAALSRWELAGVGAGLMAQRAELLLPPVVPSVRLVGQQHVVSEFVRELNPSGDTQVLGPVVTLTPDQHGLIPVGESVALIRPSEFGAMSLWVQWQQEWATRVSGLRRRWVTAGRRPPSCVASPVF